MGTRISRNHHAHVRRLPPPPNPPPPPPHLCDPHPPHPLSRRNHPRRPILLVVASSPSVVDASSSLSRVHVLPHSPSVSRVWLHSYCRPRLCGGDVPGGVPRGPGDDVSSVLALHPWRMHRPPREHPRSRLSCLRCCCQGLCLQARRGKPKTWI